MVAWLGMAGGLRAAQAPFALAICAALVVRREYPVAVWLWIGAVGVAELVVGVRPGLYTFAVAVAFYTVVAYGPRWARRLALPAALVAAVVATARWMGGPDVPMSGRLYGLLALASPLVIAWVAGEYSRTRRAYFEHLEERAERAERERDTRARMAVAEERARIARELHDVVAHSVSVMVIQSDGAASALDEGDAASARTAVRAIGATGRTALGELRRLLGVLGTGAAGAAEPYAPLPGIGDLDALVARVRDAGLPVKLEVEGEPREVSQGRALAVYRIVQESLTNTLKHAGTGAGALVRIGYEPGTLAVQVDDDGRGPAAAGALDADGRAGHGLVGMRERTAMFGGTLYAGPRRPHGFTVLARLPWGAE